MTAGRRRRGGGDDAHYARSMRFSPLDIHCHGAVGSGFGAAAGGSREAAAHHHRRGVPGVVASLVSATPEATLAQVRVLGPLVADSTLVGVHLEGPFLSPSRAGAHDPRVLRDPDPTLIEQVVEALAAAGAADGLRQVTLAPELPGALDLIGVLAEHGVVPAFGHTAATAAQLRAAVEVAHDRCARAPIITHLFNGMPAFHHRAPGPAAAALAAAARGEAFVELIADGVHLAPETVRMVFEVVGPQQVVLVSDATAATGMGDGRHRIGSLEVTVRGGVARLTTADGSPGPIAGSTVTLADCVTWAVQVAGVSRADAERAAGETPRRALALS